MGWLGGSHHCGCGRTVPRGTRSCPKCARAGNRRAAPSSGSRSRSAGAPRRCGKHLASGGSCGGFVPANGRCDRCGSS